jgi:hypothetical protein
MPFGVLALAAASGASATTFPLGTIPNFYITSGTPFTTSVTAIFGNGFDISTTFDDSFTFTIPTRSGTASDSISTSFSSAANHLKISKLWINGTLYTVPTTASGQSITLGNIPITAGVMNTIRVVGKSGLKGGSYTGTVTFTAIVVPEATTWAMMLAGFGLMGAALRARKARVQFA